MENCKSLKNSNFWIAIFTGVLACVSVLSFCIIKNQTEISHQLSIIEQYRHDQYVKEKRAEEMSARKRLKNTKDELIQLFWKIGNQNRGGVILNPPREKKLVMAKQIYDLLFQEIDNFWIVNDEEVLLKWLNSINALEVYSKNDKFLSDIFIEDHMNQSDEDFKKSFHGCIGMVQSNILSSYITLKPSFNLHADSSRKKLDKANKRQSTYIKK